MSWACRLGWHRRRQLEGRVFEFGCTGCASRWRRIPASRWRAGEWEPLA